MYSEEPEEAVIEQEESEESKEEMKEEAPIVNVDISDERDRFFSGLSVY